MTLKAKKIQRYYDAHPVPGEEMGQGFFHQLAIEYLMLVLKWFFAGQKITVAGDVNIYITNNPKEIPLSPDVAVIDGLVISDLDRDDAQSYTIGDDGPAPRVVFEAASRETWREDLVDKPDKYAAMGIREYFAFDPNFPTYWTKTWKLQDRLVGWRRDETGGYSRIEKRDDGKMWSEELNSWVIVESNYLRLYTLDGQLRLTKAEAIEQQAEAERQRAENERRRAENERQRAERLAERLRQMGENPDEL